MPNYIVAQHIDDFMKSSSVFQAQNILGITTTESNYETLSNFVIKKVTELSLEEVNSSFEIPPNKSGFMFLYTGSSNISAFVTSSINLSGFTASFAQLSSGSITILLNSYPSGRIISYGDLYETAGEGSTANVTRVTNNNFLLTGLLQ
jgi:hypothetical protein